MRTTHTERLLEDVLNNAPEGIDTRQGSIFYDAVSGVLIKVAKLYTDLDLVVELSRLTTTTGAVSYTHLTLPTT